MKRKDHHDEFDPQEMPSLHETPNKGIGVKELGSESKGIFGTPFSMNLENEFNQLQNAINKNILKLFKAIRNDLDEAVKESENLKKNLICERILKRISESELEVRPDDVSEIEGRDYLQGKIEILEKKLEIYRINMRELSVKDSPFAGDYSGTKGYRTITPKKIVEHLDLNSENLYRGKSQTYEGSQGKKSFL
jgi:hypothetical protein